MDFSPDDAEKNVNQPRLSGKVKSLCLQKIILYVLCGALVLISMTVLITFIALQVPKIYTENYAVVIDAGSTGSRAYLYKWKDSADEQNDIVTEMSNCKADKVQALDWTDPNNGLVTCISNVIVDIPTSFLNRPFIYLASTAGMRLYEAEYPNETRILFKNVEAIFAKKQWRSQYIGIISGEDEGTSAWITANFLKNKIGKGVKKQPTVGALDLGGSSTQIAYETISSKTKIPLYNNEYPMYSKSYLCYGTNMFYLKYMTYVAVTNTETSFSCLLNNTPIALLDDVKVCRYNGSENLNFTGVTKTAKSDPVNCARQVSAVVDSGMTFEKTPPGSKFVAISSYNYVYRFFEKYFGPINSMADFENYTSLFCNEDYSAMSGKYLLERKYGAVYCVMGNYISKLFKEFGITDIKNLEFIDKIEGQSVGWNLGYMIDKTRSLPASFVHRINQSLFLAIVIIFAILLAGSGLSLLYLVWERRQKVDNIDL